MVCQRCPNLFPKEEKFVRSLRTTSPKPSDGESEAFGLFCAVRMEGNCMEAQPHIILSQCTHGIEDGEDGDTDIGKDGHPHRGETDDG